MYRAYSSGIERGGNCRSSIPMGGAYPLDIARSDRGTEGRREITRHMYATQLCSRRAPGRPGASCSTAALNKRPVLVELEYSRLDIRAFALGCLPNTEWSLCGRMVRCESREPPDTRADGLLFSGASGVTPHQQWQTAQQEGHSAMHGAVCHHGHKHTDRPGVRSGAARCGGAVRRCGGGRGRGRGVGRVKPPTTQGGCVVASARHVARAHCAEGVGRRAKWRSRWARLKCGERAASKDPEQ